jgi:peptidoglycan/xylan/chitin deacetylase (PgdA/CDA1 family)
VNKLIALTFDDGPNTDCTVKILDELKKYGATASFFVNPVKFNDETLPVIRRMIDENHDVENHSYSHIRFGDDYPSKEKAREDLVRTSQAIFEATGRMPFAFRAPYFEWGGKNNILHGLDRELNMVFVDAAIDTNDWQEERTPQDIAAAILGHENPNGAVVLMHDCGGSKPRDRQRTVDSLALFIPQLTARGYKFVSVRQLFLQTGAEPEIFAGSDTWQRPNQRVSATQQKD